MANSPKDTDMTMPNERARALRFAGELMRELMSREDVPADLKQQAKHILRHYPDSHDIAYRAEVQVRDDGNDLLGPWLAPEDMYSKKQNPTI